MSHLYWSYLYCAIGETAWVQPHRGPAAASPPHPTSCRIYSLSHDVQRKDLGGTKISSHCASERSDTCMFSSFRENILIINYIINRLIFDDSNWLLLFPCIAFYLVVILYCISVYHLSNSSMMSLVWRDRFIHNNKYIINKEAVNELQDDREQIVGILLSSNGCNYT